MTVDEYSYNWILKVGKVGLPQLLTVVGLTNTYQEASSCFNCDIIAFEGAVNGDVDKPPCLYHYIGFFPTEYLSVVQIQMRNAHHRMIISSITLIAGDGLELKPRTDAFRL